MSKRLSDCPPESYVIEGLVDGEWQELATGTAVGHKKIDRIAPTTVAALRLRVTEAVGEPMIRSLAVYHTAAGGR